MPVVRAVPAVAVGLAITFLADHSARIGLLMLGAFAVLTGAVLVWGAFRQDDRVLRTISLIQGVVSIVVGIVALIVNGGGIGFFLFLFSVFAAVTGFLELYAGLRAKGRNPAYRDLLAVGGFTAIAALVFLLAPLDSVQAVGLFGAYAIMVGIFLAIAGLSLKWAAPAAESKG
ncbi:DUF308 domain-containing protein [Cryobacterium sp. BB736]|uniref:DUF308 domain-containing protein n=1 Tax=Cryobacterium sp. BB736 TaxID=2746963 RepID=UPI001876203E